MLFYIFALALMSDWICYSIAPIMHLVEVEFPTLSPSLLVSTFLAANVLATVWEPWLVSAKGLRFSIVLAATLMFVGSALKMAAVSFGAGSAPLLMLGNVLVGVSQPFFNITPSSVSMNWFGDSERTVATAISLNANQMGICFSYVVGGSSLKSVDDLDTYFQILTLLAGVLLIGVALQFKSEPATPPTSSAAEVREKRMGLSLLKHDDYTQQIFTVIKKDGFPNTVLAFASGVLVVNVFATFSAGFLSVSPQPFPPAILSPPLLNANEIALSSFPQPYVGSLTLLGLIGAGFQLCFVVGSVMLGSYVDRTKSYYATGLVCLAASCFLMVFFMGALDVGALGWCIPLMMGLALASGPLEPIAAETAIEVAYPADENLVVAVQEFSGNLLSAVLVPIMNALRTDSICYTKGLFVVLAILVGNMIYYSTFSGTYRRIGREAAIRSSSAKHVDDRHLDPLKSWGHEDDSYHAPVVL